MRPSGSVPYDDEKLGFYKVAKYYYHPGWWEGGTTNHILINNPKWMELPKSYQAIVTAAAGFANVEEQARYDSRKPQALKVVGRQWRTVAAVRAGYHGGLPEGVEK
jgi:TRAP-type mannitol/chloroaromatic compound transport system substrate-binding protein